MTSAIFYFPKIGTEPGNPRSSGGRNRRSGKSFKSQSSSWNFWENSTIFELENLWQSEPDLNGWQ